MCGIIGSFPIQDRQHVSTGLKRICHRGPDAQQLVDVRHGTLGHSRLSIIDVAGGSQPMRSGGRWIVFNGEIYNYQKLRRELPGAFRTGSDTEVVLQLFAAHGSSAMNRLDGMYAFAILDGDQLFLARDPIGIKPLYYARKSGRLYFASEIKALLPFTGEIQEFPAGHIWQTGASPAPERFSAALRPPASSPPQLTLEAALARIRQVLSQAVQKRMIADEGVPVGVSLSGGLDSSIIAALARESRAGLKTFAVGMAGSEDLEASRQVAQFLGTGHHLYVYTFAEMLAALPEVIYYLESFDAALVRSALPNYFLARLAADHVKVILTGEGADELFAGYDYLRPLKDPQRLDRELRTITANLHNTNLQRTDRMTMAHGIEGRVPFLDLQVIATAFDLPAAWKMTRPDWPEKQLLRRSCDDLLPRSIIERPKQKFSQGTGSAELIAAHARDLISDADFQRERRPQPGVELRSREELLYYRIFREQFGDRLAPEVIGRTRSVAPGELT